ncbi:DNA-binding response regulator [Nocardioides sp.]|uniref:response regulator transcription factor n=1 Tax=Nocardioides sp. TaxID=35761 RepID=UPI003D0B9E29
MSISRTRPIAVALANDYELVVLGLAHLLAPYPDRVRMVEMVAGVPVTSDVDLTLYDTFAQPQVDADDIERVIAGDGAGRVVVFTWNLQPELIEMAIKKGASGYLSKSLSGTELVETLERIHDGEVVVSELHEAAETATDDWNGGLWPGQSDGLTVRESEVVALITLGLSNKEIASRAYLSINSVKSYIRSAYRKMGVTTRSQAVLWAVHHGFLPDSVRYGGEPGTESTA